MKIIRTICVSTCSALKATRWDGIVPTGIKAIALLSVVAGHAFAQDWTLTSAPTNFWRNIATSADGTKVVATGDDALIYASTNSGADWSVLTAPDKWWGELASSADGTILLALGNDYMFVTNGYDIYENLTTPRIYTSTNSGASWAIASSAPTDANWTSATSSADGRKMAASTTSKIYTSTNAGRTWTLRNAPSKQWNSIACSADGTRLVAVAVKGGIYTSADSGATWIPTSAPNDFWWWSVASSEDGTKLVAVALYNAQASAGGPIYVSKDAGTNWLVTSAPSNNWVSVASSADATTLVAAGTSNSPVGILGVICLSRDSGATWMTTNPPSPSSGNSNWRCVAASADGNKLYAGVSYGGIHTLQTPATPLLSITAAGSASTISWIIPSMDFVLQENSDLTTTNWTDVTTTPTVTNYQNQVTLPPPSGNRFYQLISH